MSCSRGDLESDTETVYVELLNEGTTVYRPTQAQPLGDGVYLVMPTVNYDPEDEEWAHPPGSRVRCSRETLDGQELLVARRRVP